MYKTLNNYNNIYNPKEKSNLKTTTCDASCAKNYCSGKTTDNACCPGPNAPACADPPNSRYTACSGYAGSKSCGKPGCWSWDGNTSGKVVCKQDTPQLWTANNEPCMAGDATCPSDDDSYSCPTGGTAPNTENSYNTKPLCVKANSSSCDPLNCDSNSTASECNSNKNASCIWDSKSSKCVTKCPASGDCACSKVCTSPLNLVPSCHGSTCTEDQEGYFCPPGVPGSSSIGYCCKSGKWKNLGAGGCNGVSKWDGVTPSCHGSTCTAADVGKFCPPGAPGSSFIGNCCVETGLNSGQYIWKEGQCGSEGGCTTRCNSASYKGCCSDYGSKGCNSDNDCGSGVSCLDSKTEPADCGIGYQGPDLANAFNDWINPQQGSPSFCGLPQPPCIKTNDQVSVCNGEISQECCSGTCRTEIYTPPFNNYCT